VRPLELSKHPADVTAPATTLAETVWKERAERARVKAAAERIVDSIVLDEKRKGESKRDWCVRMSSGAT
jgi:hypothetical protein